MLASKQLEDWLTAHLTLVALVIVAAGGAVRVYYALATYLNPDEAMHFLSANQLALASTYRSSLHTAHPPLFLIALHAALGLGNSELVLRLPSLLAGTAALWLAFRWMQRGIGGAAGLVGLVALAGAPVMIAAAAETRQYAFLLCFVCAALYCMERCFADRSAAWVAGFAASLYGAILSHYTAAWITLTLGVYVAHRLWAERPPQKVIAAWVLSQLGAAAIYLGLYVTHLRTLRGSGMEAVATSGWLKYQYYRPGEEEVAGFAWRALGGVFTYLAGGPRLGMLAAVAFVAGLIMVAAKWPRDASPVRRDYVALLALPLLIGLTAAVADLLPFGRTRHVSYLSPFVAAGVAIAVARALRYNLSLITLLAVIVGPWWLVTTTPANSLTEMRHSDVEDLLAYLDAALPDDAIIFVDGQTYMVLAYYLERDQPGLMVRRGTVVNDTRLDRYRIVSLPESWAFNDDVAKEVTTASQALALPRGAPLWVMTVGPWSGDVLVQRLPTPSLLTVKRFGEITLVQTAVGYW
ncbi:MAG: glycosyltransferase family 39 protein [Candidatus Binatia bacterium]